MSIDRTSVRDREGGADDGRTVPSGSGRGGIGRLDEDRIELMNVFHFRTLRVLHVVLAHRKGAVSLLPGRRPIERVAGALRCRFDEAVRKGAREPAVPALFPRLEEASTGGMSRVAREIRPTRGEV